MDPHSEHEGFGEAMGRWAWSWGIREATHELNDIPGGRHKDRKEESIFRQSRAAPRGWRREGGDDHSIWWFHPVTLDFKMTPGAGPVAGCTGD